MAPGEFANRQIHIAEGDDPLRRLRRHLSQWERL